jgi:HlyD family secretion protein
MTRPSARRLAFLAILAVVLVAGFYVWQLSASRALPDGIAKGNGRIEAVEIDIATKMAGRLDEILVKEGDFVKTGQVLARMDTTQIKARKRQAEAALRRARIGVDTARSVVTQRNAERNASVAVVEQRRAQYDAAQKRLDRSEQLIKTDTVSAQVLDTDRANAEGAKAALSAAEASVAASDAAIGSAKAMVVDAEAAVDAAQAALESIDAELDRKSVV